jgi:hypothetical protein
MLRSPGTRDLPRKPYICCGGRQRFVPSFLYSILRLLLRWFVIRVLLIDVWMIMITEHVLVC